MRTAATLAFIAILTFPAVAADGQFDGQFAVRTWNALDQECRMGETDGGTELTADQASAACDRLHQSTADLKANGYCWDKAEYEWTAPGHPDVDGKICPVTTK